MNGILGFSVRFEFECFIKTSRITFHKWIFFISDAQATGRFTIIFGTLRRIALKLKVYRMPREDRFFISRGKCEK